ncbi:MAG: polysaccharide deacetylase family protein [Candidatus Harrisonbacteria bacterium]|nr:polysaccharide deacetylase family protein [Candidatus Harrisonbacteria bacterium]
MKYSINDKHIVINYHYVENPSRNWSGIHPCSIDEFNRQVKFLSENYKFGSLVDVFQAAKNNNAERVCAITFDDGLRDQYENTLPILKKGSATATFFIITAALEGRLPPAHRIHVLLSKIAINDLINLFNEYLKEFYSDLQKQYFIPKDRRLTQRRLHEDIPTANFKETLIMLPEDIKAQFLRYCFKKQGLDSERLSRQIFMGAGEIRELQRAGMQIGAHTHQHYALDTMNPEAIKNDINLNKAGLDSVLGFVPEVFSYPHGRYQPAAVSILRDEKFKHAVTIEKRGVSGSDDPLLMPRYDTNDLRDFLNLR